ncbi:MAG: hypothetical protein HY760_01950 [Nitrospirae bacterium]|nr:hypothetical protein [Nitrospirota bacterium]
MPNAGSNESDGPGFRPEIARCEAPPANAVYLCRNADLSTEDTVAVDLMISSEIPVFGMAVDLTFEPAKVSLVRKTDQTLDYALPEGTVWKRTFLNLQQGREDRLILGVSRKKGDPLITGNVPMITLKFRVLSEESPLFFSNNRLVGEGGRPVEGGGYHWYGGFLIEGTGKTVDRSAVKRSGGDGKVDI